MENDPLMCDEDSDTSERELASKKYFVNVEPVIFLFSISFGSMLTVQPLFLYWARCTEIFQPITNASDMKLENVSMLCANLSDINNTIYQDIVETDISRTRIFIQMASSIPTLIVAPLMGTWSDGTGGRRAPLVVALVGLLLYCFLHFLATLIYTCVNVYYILFVAEAIIGCCGGFAALFSAALSIVTDDSRDKLIVGSSSVPLRVGIASAVQSFGILVGNLVIDITSVPARVSVVDHARSYVKVTGAATLCSVIALLYALFFVRETHRVLCSRTTGNSGRITSIPWSSLWLKSKRFLYEVFEVILRPRDGWIRISLIVALFSVFVEIMTLDNQLLLLLLKRYPFSWTDSEFGLLSTLKSFLTSLGMIVFPLIIERSKYLGRDSLLIMIGIFASSVQFFAISFAQSSFAILLATSFSFFVGCISPGYRSFLPRLVAKEETARLFSSFGIIMTISPIISAVVFNKLFVLTIDFWPGFAFFVGGVLQLIVFGGQLLVHYLLLPIWVDACRTGEPTVTEGERLREENNS